LCIPSLRLSHPSSTLFPYTTLFRSHDDSRIMSDLRAAGCNRLQDCDFQSQDAARGAPTNRIMSDIIGVRVRCAFLVNPVDCPSRSEEHTSEPQSPCNLVCRLLLEKK